MYRAKYGFLFGKVDELMFEMDFFDRFGLMDEILQLSRVHLFFPMVYVPAMRAEAIWTVSVCSGMFHGG